jgi:hypothetical protein
MAKTGSQETIGFSDSGSSGGYESVDMGEGRAQSEAKGPYQCHGAGDIKAKDQPNKAGGPRAGT